MADQFDRYRGATGTGWTPHEKGTVKTLGDVSNTRVVVKHPETSREPVNTGVDGYEVDKRDFWRTLRLRRKTRRERIADFITGLLVLTLIGSVAAFMLWFLFLVVRGMLTG